MNSRIKRMIMAAGLDRSDFYRSTMGEWTYLGFSLEQLTLSDETRPGTLSAGVRGILIALGE